MIVVSDVDNTLVDPGGGESKSCRRLFATLRADNTAFGFATSRSYPSLTAVLPVSTKLSDFNICSDGAILLARRDGTGPVAEVVHRVCLTFPRKYLDPVARLRSRNASCFVFFDDQSGYSVAADIVPAHRESLERILQGRVLIGRVGVTPAMKSDVLSIGILDTLEDCNSFGDHMTELCHDWNLRVRIYPELRVPELDLYWCEFSAHGAEKSVGVRTLCAFGNIDLSPHALVVLGDGENDIELARMADFAFCPPWASLGMLSVCTVLNGVTNCAQFAEKALIAIHQLTV